MLAQYLKLARELSGYGDIVFPHCACDSRKEGHVVPAVGMASFKLHAAKEDGTLESQVVEFQWNTIARWEVDEDGMAFCFQYTRQDNRPPRWLKVFTPYVSTITNSSRIDPQFITRVQIFHASSPLDLLSWLCCICSIRSFRIASIE